MNRDSRVAPNGQLRLTSQLTSRDKLRGAYYNSNGRTQRYDVGCTATSGNRVSCVAPEAAYALPTPVQQSGDLKWTSTVTNRLLVEVGASFGVASYRFEYQPENGPHDILHNDTFTGWRTVASGTPYQDYLSTVWNVIPKVSYVTGSHNFKAGMNLEWGDDRNYIDNHDSISTLSLNSSRPLASQATSVTVRNTPGATPERAERRLRILRPGSLDHEAASRCSAGSDTTGSTPDGGISSRRPTRSFPSAPSPQPTASPAGRTGRSARAPRMICSAPAVRR